LSPSSILKFVLFWCLIIVSHIGLLGFRFFCIGCSLYYVICIPVVICGVCSFAGLYWSVQLTALVFVVSKFVVFYLGLVVLWPRLFFTTADSYIMMVLF
jgi:hypothetical protein